MFNKTVKISTSSQSPHLTPTITSHLCTTTPSDTSNLDNPLSHHDDVHLDNFFLTPLHATTLPAVGNGKEEERNIPNSVEMRDRKASDSAYLVLYLDARPWSS